MSSTTLTFVTLTFLALYLAACVFVFSFVHLRLVFLEPAALLQSDIPYYVGIDASPANYLSADSFIYISDFARVFLPFFIAAAPLMSRRTAGAGVRWLLVVLCVVAGLADVAKFIFLFLYQQHLFGFVCQTYAFCVNRDPLFAAEAPPGTPDVTFTAETYSCLAFALAEFILICLVQAIYSSQRKKEKADYTELRTDTANERLPTLKDQSGSASLLSFPSLSQR